MARRPFRVLPNPQPSARHRRRPIPNSRVISRHKPLREWGRIGSPGRIAVESFATQEEARRGGGTADHSHADPPRLQPGRSVKQAVSITTPKNFATGNRAPRSRHRADARQLAISEIRASYGLALPACLNASGMNCFVNDNVLMLHE